jgi:hypothetical protein
LKNHWEAIKIMASILLNVPIIVISPDFEGSVAVK